MRASATKCEKKLEIIFKKPSRQSQWSETSKNQLFFVLLTKSIAIPYQSIGKLTHTPALNKPKEIECDEVWTASTDRSSASLEDTAAGPCQTKPDLTESLRAVGTDNKVRDDL